MSAFYLTCLLCVAGAIVAMLLDAILNVLRPTAWQVPHRHALSLAPTIDRRNQALPFVGAERRQALNTIDAALAFAEVRRAA
jgi:hypothetical protein